MTTSPLLQNVGDLSDLLGGGLRSLDITTAEHDRITARYQEMGQELELHWSGTQGDNVVSPQGSFLLGTVVRNVHRNDDIDIDCVALRDVDKRSVTQAGLKADVGVAAHRYAGQAYSSRPRVSQCTRCWTLSWPGMHLDILPAIPNRDLEGKNIWITDREVRNWSPSNPAGYADWFHSRMREEFLSQRAVLAKQLDVEEVPVWQVKTTLQQAVQALKRHRDIYFADRLDDRPPSIIITTLAALAYTGRGDLFDVLRDITRTMDERLVREGSRWVLANPAQQDENFADSWATHPERAVNFFTWLGAARAAFDDLGRHGDLEEKVSRLGETFGDRFAKAAAESASRTLHEARVSGRLGVAAGGALLLTTPRRSVRDHGFAGGSSR